MRKPEPWYRFAVSVLRPPLAMWFNWRYEGLESVPREGPVLIACNHVSYFDPLAHGLMVIKAHRRPRFLAKSELYDKWLTRHVLVGAKQIRVDRGSGSTAPIDSAVASLKQGEAVVIYPEATITKNPDYTPMQGKTGVARLTLATGVPVLPAAVWGSQHVLQREGVKSLKFGRPIWLKVGTPLDFSEYEDRRDDLAALHEVTDAVMDELTRLVTDLRSRYPKQWDQ